MSRSPFGLLAFLTAAMFAAAPVDRRLPPPAPIGRRTCVKNMNRGPYSRAREEARRVRQGARLEAKRVALGRA